MRHWIILRRTDYPDGNEWAQITAVRAWTRRGAVRLASSGALNPYHRGDFVAVPLRWWRIQERDSNTTIGRQ